MYGSNPVGWMVTSAARFHVKPNPAIRGRRTLRLNCAAPPPPIGPTQFVSPNNPQSYPQEYPPRYPPGMRGAKAANDPLRLPRTVVPEPTRFLLRTPA
jgi:hypothetical protein